MHINFDAVLVVIAFYLTFICVESDKSKLVKNVITSHTNDKTASAAREITKNLTLKEILTTAPPSVAINTKMPKIKLKPMHKNRVIPKMITPEMIKEWSLALSKGLFEHEENVVRRKEILKHFANVKTELRNGSFIIEKVSNVLEEIFNKRAEAAENIMRTAEELAKNKVEVPNNYQFKASKGLSEIKKVVESTSEWEHPVNCHYPQRVKLADSKHFDANISLETSSVHVAAEVFDCDPRVIDAIYYSEELLSTFQRNYELDAMLAFQYFCSAKGFLRQYPAASWETMLKLNVEGDDIADVYDCRLRSWYVSASGAPRDVLILLDASGSMNSSNKVVAEIFTQALLNALTDDDQINVIRFNMYIESPISCFNDKLVSANHVNTDAMMDALKDYVLINFTKVKEVFEFAVPFLHEQSSNKDRPPSCQQAIVLITDSLYYDFTDLLMELDPDGKIRVFVLWLHDIYGLRDNTLEYGKMLSCTRDGSFAELLTYADVNLQVMRILQVMERPLVAQRKERLRVFSDMYAHIEDPRKGEYHWVEKENMEQIYRYRELRKNKDDLLNMSHIMKDYIYQHSLDKFGHYYEGEDVNYRMMISVSVPVFEHIMFENITIQLDEEDQRNSTREYPVNRLLGVAGVDIPIDHLKLLLPYHEIGPGGSIFMVDHRGRIILHDNLKPTITHWIILRTVAVTVLPPIRPNLRTDYCACKLDGDILKPGYRTVDLLDLEQPCEENHLPRHYPTDWLNLRRGIIIDQRRGRKDMCAKNIFDHGMRASIEYREYHWRRIMEHYTAVVVLPPYARLHAVSESHFTQKLADDAFNALTGTDFAVHPDWLYCRHVDQFFEIREREVLHFLRRRKDEPNFKMQQLKHFFSPIPPSVNERTYQCDEKLMARMCHDAIATAQWAREREDIGVRDCSVCRLGSTTAFFAAESGLTRWQLYHATSEHAAPPEGSEWANGPTEPWYRRAAAAPGTLVVHAPAFPVRRMRNSYLAPKSSGVRAKWLTAARTLDLPDKSNIGVAGFHFYPTHFEDMIDAITNFPCPEEDEEKCEARCDGENWSCVLIDDSGWIVGGVRPSPDLLSGEGVRPHLATTHPAVMEALLNSSVFKLRWIHDYQAVCFESESTLDGAPTLISVITSLTRTVALLFHVGGNMLKALTLLWTTSSAIADTQFEKDKRRRRLKKDYEREKYETLYDDRVLVNRSTFTACDRSRAVYEFQNTMASKAALRRPAEQCSWPLVASPLERTNLILIAVYTLCPYKGRPIPNPLINEVVDISEIDDEGEYSTKASRLACWRNRVSLPNRPPATACYQHNFNQEEGYRQCGPWLPDPEPDSHIITSAPSKILLSILLFIALY